jgi:hypothetical protein
VAKKFTLNDLKTTAKQKPRLVDVTTSINGMVMHFDNGQAVEISGCHHGTPDMLDLTGHDFCLYCGHDNGPQGEWRSGHDCQYCGSN